MTLAKVKDSNSGTNWQRLMVPLIMADVCEKIQHGMVNTKDFVQARQTDSQLAGKTHNIISSFSFFFFTYISSNIYIVFVCTTSQCTQQSEDTTGEELRYIK